MTLDRWEQSTRGPLTLAALAFLVAYAWPILDPDLPPAAHVTAEVVTWVVWGLFVVDYVVRVALAPDRWRFVRSHPLDLAAVVLPVLRPLRLLRLVALLTVLQREATPTLRGRVVTYAAGATALLLLVSSLAVLDAERYAPQATIVSFGGAAWWSVTTITSVGYGDLAPVTPTGRVVACVLMFAGVALLGIVTATVASLLVERVADEDADERTATRAQVHELTRLVAQLHEQAGLGAAPDQRGPRS